MTGHKRFFIFMHRALVSIWISLRMPRFPSCTPFSSHRFLVFSHFCFGWRLHYDGPHAVDRVFTIWRWFFAACSANHDFDGHTYGQSTPWIISIGYPKYFWFISWIRTDTRRTHWEKMSKLREHWEHESENWELRFRILSRFLIFFIPILMNYYIFLYSPVKWT